MHLTVYPTVSCIRTRTAVIGGIFMPSSRRNFVKECHMLKATNAYAIVLVEADEPKGLSMPKHIEQVNNSNAVESKLTASATPQE
jgi:hypothetical protein